MKKIIRYAWKEWDQADLERLYALGLSDAEIARRMERHPHTLMPHRRKLGPPHGKGGGPAGWKHSAQARAKISAANYKRWKDPVARLVLLNNLRHGPAAAKLRRFRPDKGTPEARLYRKLHAILGRDAALEAIQPEADVR